MLGGLRSRYALSLAFLIMSTGLLLVLMISVPPDLSLENDIRRQIALFSAKIDHSQRVIVDRKDELQNLLDRFSSLARQLLAALPDKNRNKLGRAWKGQAEALLSGANSTYDLSLPSIRGLLPHVAHQSRGLAPAMKISTGRSDVSMVFGIPTAKRDQQSYLHDTLLSIFNNMTPDEAADSLVIVFIAEVESDFVGEVCEMLKKEFASQLASGLLDVVAPPKDYYPDWTQLRQTLGDPMDRVRWRSKQNLDFAFLMMYAQGRGTFYVQLEDDIVTKSGFVTTMLNFALDKMARKEPWFVINFCQLGFIGKMFHSANLPVLVQFFLAFYNDQPVDWLLERVIQTKVCRLDRDAKKCRQEAKAIVISYKPSLFQHVGMHSSLKGKVQKLKDKQFSAINLFKPHRNPPATFEYNIRCHRRHTFERAYRGETFFWGLTPQPGDQIVVSLDQPTVLAGLRLVSGNAEHPSDRFLKTRVQIRPDGGEFADMGAFDAKGVAEINFEPRLKVAAVRLVVDVVHEKWAILSEIHFRAPSEEESEGRKTPRS